MAEGGGTYNRKQATCAECGGEAVIYEVLTRVWYCTHACEEAHRKSDAYAVWVREIVVKRMRIPNGHPDYLEINTTLNKELRKTKYVNVPIVRALIEEFAAHVTQMKDFYMYRTTILMMCLEQGHNEIARLLVEHGSDVNHVNLNKMTPLDIAIARNNTEMIEFLRTHNAVSYSSNLPQ
jgi:ankyrin repeat protein